MLCTGHFFKIRLLMLLQENCKSVLISHTVLILVTGLVGSDVIKVVNFVVAFKKFSESMVLKLQEAYLTHLN
jgi:hypothetical protein